MNEQIAKRANKVKSKKKFIKIIKLVLLFLLLLLLIGYIVMSIIYNNGNFTISLDKNLYMKNNIIIYDNPDYKVYRSELNAPSIEYLDNIKYSWLPNDVNEHNGSHNGENYIAYTFYVENMGDDTSDYWTEILIDDAIKGVDEAVRIRVYKDGVPITYAKHSKNGGPEDGTIAFDSDKMVAMDHIENFKPNDKIKYTIVIWLEGSDPDCTDNILGGEIKLHMEFNSEFVDK